MFGSVPSNPLTAASFESLSADVACCRMGSRGAGAEMEWGVQGVYWGSASAKGKERKQNWAEGKVGLQSGTNL